jgi:hypothetical protein
MHVNISNGQTLCFPIKFQDSVQAVFSFDVATADVKPMLPRDIKPLSMGYGLSEMYIFWMMTPSSDLGPLNEVQIGIVVEDPFYRSPATFLIANPVSSAIAKNVSFELWNLPKTVATFEFDYAGADTTCTMLMDGREALRLSGPVLSGPGFEISSMLCFASSGSSKVFRYVHSTASCGTLERPENARLSLGDHPLGNTLAKLIRSGPLKRYSYRDKSHIMIGPTLDKIL